MKAFKELAVSFVEAIKSPFEAIAVIVDETRRENLDGKYNGYWARKNRQMELRELRSEYRSRKKDIKNKWKGGE